MKHTKIILWSFAAAKLQAIIAIAMIAVIGLSFAACNKGKSGDGTGIPGISPGFITINGLPSNMASVGVFKSGTDISTKSKYDAARNSDSNALAVGLNMNLSEFNKIPLAKANYAGGLDVFWTGTGSFPVALTNDADDSVYYYATVKFSKGNATVNFSSFKEIK
jgi:hypothetical protein